MGGATSWLRRTRIPWIPDPILCTLGMAPLAAGTWWLFLRWSNIALANEVLLQRCDFMVQRFDEHP